jgi:hypothetical protein
MKIGKSVPCPVQGLDEWDKKNLVICRALRKLRVTDAAAAEKLGIAVRDHIVIGHKGHASFRTLGLL